MELGERFARALAAKDAGALRAVLAADVDFRGLTPGRFWEAASADVLVDEVLLGAWLEPSDRVESLDAVEVSSVEGRERVTYRMSVTNDSGPHVVEQVAFYDTSGDRITWLRVLCSGFRAVAAPVAGSAPT